MRLLDLATTSSFLLSINFFLALPPRMTGFTKPSWIHRSTSVLPCLRKASDLVIRGCWLQISENTFSVPCFAATSNIPRSLSGRSEEHTSELQSLMRISYAVFCLKKHKQTHSIFSY